MNIYTFRVIIEPDENNSFHGFAPSLPGCHTFGKTIEETKKNLKDAIRAYIASLISEKKLVPRERGLEFFQTISEKEVGLVAK